MESSINSSNNAQNQNDDFWAFMRSKEDTGQSNLYRYEMDGILVYDSRARVYDEDSNLHNQIPKREIPLQIRNEIALSHDYDYQQYLNMKSYTPFKQLPQEYTIVIPAENTLKFNSKFESGNLRKAIKHNEDLYDLLLEFDMETQGHTQWFYFSVENYKANHKVRFNIINLMKRKSLFNDGMKPLIFSKREFELTGKEWYRDGTMISYFQNNIQRPSYDKSKIRYYFTLTFTFTFKHENDLVYFAYSFPYNYTQLMDDLSSYSSNPNASQFLRVNPLCRTLAGNICPVLTITENISTYTSWEQEYKNLQKSAAARKLLKQKILRQQAHIRLIEKYKSNTKTDDNKNTNEHKNKKAVVLTARVHPGESNSSYMMKGAIEFLLGNSKEAIKLRRKYIFKIIPMLNPDGVIYGNYRCSLLGVDLNRRWINPNKYMHPTIYYSKKIVQMLSEEREIALHCDMHGHSTKKDIFIYACKSTGDLDDTRNNLFIKLFPFLLAKRNGLISYKNSRFRMEKYKEKTSRIVFFREFGILNSFTLESSFFGPSKKNLIEESHISQENLETIGKDLCKQLMIFFCPILFRKKLQELCNFLYGQFSFVKSRTEIRQICSSFDREENKSEIGSIADICLTQEINTLDMEENYDEQNTENIEIKELLNEVGIIYNEQITHEEAQEVESSESDSDSSDNDDKRIEYKALKIEHKNELERSKSKHLQKRQSNQLMNSSIQRPPSANIMQASFNESQKIDPLNESYSFPSTKPSIRKKSVPMPNYVRAPISISKHYATQEAHTKISQSHKVNYQMNFPLIKTIYNAEENFRNRRDSMGLKFPKDRGFIITSIHDTSHQYTNGKLIFKIAKDSVREHKLSLIKKTNSNKKRSIHHEIKQQSFELGNRSFKDFSEYV
ncbi:unnamed protein product [Blepharisma stoltei]|uniref:Peptidase M14 domain-containing protein n=1 Tax=Blepharisma stoltei TaxID=1481888 RepID=A0AAU9IZ34_9CILI|nr:unnamed protein product [Blepharisma stoltei]